MRITTLPPLPPDGTVYIVGTGPSLRCTPLSFLADKVTIGLNQAWRHIKPTYSLTVHPELALEYCDPRPPALPTKWIVKRKPPLHEIDLDDERYYVFDTSYELATVKNRPADTLYLGEGAQTTAMDLAARMGARHIVLVGCDAKAIGGEFHAHDQHVRFLGMKPADQYHAYRQTTADVRAVLRGLGVSVLTLSPFIGVDAGEEDYARLKKELKLETLPKPKDVSPYRRDPSTVRGSRPLTPPPKPKPKKKPQLRHAPKPVPPARKKK